MNLTLNIGNDVLKWHLLNGRDKYSNFEVLKGEAYF